MASGGAFRKVTKTRVVFILEWNRRLGVPGYSDSQGLTTSKGSRGACGALGNVGGCKFVLLRRKFPEMIAGRGDCAETQTECDGTRARRAPVGVCQRGDGVDAGRTRRRSR